MNAPSWHLLLQGKGTAARNMAVDEAMLEAAPELGRPILRFYGWSEPAASFGYSQKYSDAAQWTKLRPLMPPGPTGGGLVPHDSDWTYSIAIPPQHPWHRLKASESYLRVHEWIRDSFASLKIPTTLAASAQKEIPGQCFVGAEKSDVLWHGRKIAGAAQRRTRAGLLIQGSVQPPPISLDRDDWQTAMRKTGSENWAIEWTTFDLTGRLDESARHLEAAKYSQPAYNQKR